MPESLKKAGTVGKHDTWVTSLAVVDPHLDDKPEDPNVLLSSSRDGLLKLWSVPPRGEPEQKTVCKGHRDVVSSCRLSGNGQFAVSCSWDRSMIIWSLESPSAVAVRTGRVDKQLNSVVFSIDNRQIITGGGTRIDLWNTLGEIKYTLGDWIDDHRHTDWISALEFVPQTNTKDEEGNKLHGRFLSASWDHKLKLWNVGTMKFIKEFIGHKGVVHCISVSPDASLIASGGKEARVILWDLAEGKILYDLDVLSSVNSLEFNPSRYWLAVATDMSVEVYDLEMKSQIFVDRGPVLPEYIPSATCLRWSTGSGDNLFVGHSDGTISRYEIVENP